MNIVGEARDRPLKIGGEVLHGPEADRARRNAVKHAMVMRGDPVYFIGLDLGSINDYTALSIIQRIGPRELGLVYLERMRGPYPTQLDRIWSILARPPLNSVSSILIADSTGVGVAVIDMMKEMGMRPIGLTIKASGEAAWDWRTRTASVSKTDLVSLLQVSLQSGRLRVAEGLPLAALLVNELQSFQVKINDTTGRATFSAREGEHDDIVLSVALACWAAEKAPKRPKPKPVYVFQGFRH